ncbi:MAG TPA: hypothetical protein VGI23_27595 [Steroidobacteraceae bacterium]
MLQHPRGSATAPGTLVLSTPVPLDLSAGHIRAGLLSTGGLLGLIPEILRESLGLHSLRRAIVKSGGTPANCDGL